MTIQEKANELRNKYNLSSRCISTMLKAIESGIGFDKKEKILDLVLAAYKTGKHKQPAKIKGNFKKEFEFLKKEFDGIEIKPKTYL